MSFGAVTLLAMAVGEGVGVDVQEIQLGLCKVSCGRERIMGRILLGFFSR